MALPIKLLIVALLMTVPGTANALSLDFETYLLTHHPDGSERSPEHRPGPDDLLGSAAHESRFGLEVAVMFMDYRTQTPLRLRVVPARRVAAMRSGSRTLTRTGAPGVLTFGQAIALIHHEGRRTFSSGRPRPL